MAVAADDPRRPLSDGHRQGPPRAGRADRGNGERRLSRFADELRQRIRDSGPISVEAYMAACNAHYYATRDPLGPAGDFTTAPEVSQMFGEMVGASLADCWRRAGGPAAAAFVELGPGRGTLAADALRVMARAGLDPQVHFVETSPALRAAQAKRHPQARWHDDLSAVPEGGPLLIVANEFFDALPNRQWVGEEERRIMLDGDALAFTTHGPLREDSPQRDGYARALAALLAERGGVALIIDYGHARTAPGDTLQAVKAHRFADPLADPGEQDLTAHVDFEALARAMFESPVSIAGPVGQGQWLTRLGIAKRAEALARANPDEAQALESALDRLTGGTGMGELFKVMTIHSPGWPAPAGFE